MIEPNESTTIVCEICGHLNEYSKVRCRCDHPLGYPNVRKALDEREDLITRYETARRAGDATRLDEIERLASEARPTITMSVEACDDIMRDRKYRSYEQRLERGDRQAAMEGDHSDRGQVSAKLFPTYEDNVVYAALTSGKRGLHSYGAISVLWEVTEHYLGKRMSLLEENSFHFYDKHDLARLGAPIPKGYRSVWKDRAKLAVAKIGPKISGAMSLAAMNDLFFCPMDQRYDDTFIEIAIHAEEGLDSLDVKAVSVLAVPEQDDANRLRCVRDTCRKRGIEIVELT